MLINSWQAAMITSVNTASESGPIELYIHMQFMNFDSYIHCRSKNSKFHGVCVKPSTIQNSIITSVADIQFTKARKWPKCQLHSVCLQCDRKNL